MFKKEGEGECFVWGGEGRKVRHSRRVRKGVTIFSKEREKADSQKRRRSGHLESFFVSLIIRQLLLLGSFSYRVKIYLRLVMAFVTIDLTNENAFVS